MNLADPPASSTLGSKPCLLMTLRARRMSPTCASMMPVMTASRVERGSASLIRIDEEGVATVLEEMGPGGVFGRNLAFAGSMGDSLEVVARSACDILFIDYPHLLRRCQNACTYHSVLVQNMLGLLSDKAQALSERVDVLSRRSIREKLLCYFRQLAEKSGGDTGFFQDPAGKG